MVTQSSPTLRRRRLGRRLRQMRERAGLTLDDAAGQLDKTRSALNRLENGKARIDVHIVRTMMDVYDERDDSLLDLARESLRRGWWTLYGIRDRGYIGMETEASTVLEHALVTIPGLLQTEEYMRDLWDWQGSSNPGAAGQRRCRSTASPAASIRSGRAAGTQRDHR